MLATPAIHIVQKEKPRDPIPKSIETGLFYVNCRWDGEQGPKGWYWTCDKCGMTLMVPMQAIRRDKAKAQRKLQAMLEAHDRKHFELWRRALNTYGLNTCCMMRKELEAQGII